MEYTPRFLCSVIGVLFGFPVRSHSSFHTISRPLLLSLCLAKTKFYFKQTHFQSSP